MGSNKILANILPVALVLFLSITSLFVPNQAEAGVFCSVLGVFCNNKDEIELEMPNSQNMALAQASLSPDLEQSSTTKEILIVGGTSILPESSGPLSDGKDHTNETDQISLYVVHKGDTLPAIAKMFGVTTNTISWANDLKGNTVKEGQTLVIMPISGIKHTIVKGDTLKSVVLKYKGDLNEVMQYNSLALNSKLAIGDTIFIPDGEATPVVTQKYSTKNTPSSGSSNTNYSGYYIRPIVGGIKTQGIHGHNAVDLASSYGTNIMASADGKVIVAKSSGWNGGYGEYVVISHPNGTQTVYGHMSQVNVSVGDNVEQGQSIGKMGSTGNSTGNHVHFEIRGARNPF